MVVLRGFFNSAIVLISRTGRRWYQVYNQLRICPESPANTDLQYSSLVSSLWHHHHIHTSLSPYQKCLTPWALSSSPHPHLPMRSQSSRHLNLHVRHMQHTRISGMSSVLPMDKSPHPNHPHPNHFLLHHQLQPSRYSQRHNLHEMPMKPITISVMSSLRSPAESWRRYSPGYKSILVGLTKGPRYHPLLRKLRSIRSLETNKIMALSYPPWFIVRTKDTRRKFCYLRVGTGLS